MSTSEIAKIYPTIRANSAYADAVHLAHTDGTPFDFSSGHLTGQVRRKAGIASSINPTIATFTITAPTPTTGDFIQSLSAHDTGLLPLVSQAAFDALTKVYGEIMFIPDADPLNAIRVLEEEIDVSPGGNSTFAQATAPTIPLETINVIVGGASPQTTRALLGLTSQQIAYQLFLR
jgi:hypothetical protein